MSMAKITQGLPRTAANLASLPALGWLSIRSWLAYKRLIMKWSILLSSMNCIYKCVLMKRFMQLYFMQNWYQKYKGPALIMYETCREFGFLEYVVTSITHGVYISKSQSKKKLKCVIWNRERVKWAPISVMYINIQLYKKCVAVGNIWPWWNFTKHHPNYGLRKPAASSMCQECTIMVADSIHHMLFECESASQIRSPLWRCVNIRVPSDSGC